MNLNAVPLRFLVLSADSLCIQRFDAGLGLITPINPMMAGISLVPPPPLPPDMPIIKEIIHCQTCTLFPQNPSKNQNTPQTRIQNLGPSVWTVLMRILFGPV